MATRKRPTGVQKSTGTRKTTSAARLKLVKIPPKKTADFADGLVKEGRPPAVGTVIYVHGIGNTPEASVLKCQWDLALFGADMGDRTRLAYWVDRERYPSPEDATCADGERLRPPEPEWPEIGGASIKST